jgi:hypothetical protein
LAATERIIDTPGVIFMFFERVFGRDGGVSGTVAVLRVFALVAILAHAPARADVLGVARISSNISSAQPTDARVNLAMPYANPVPTDGVFGNLTILPSDAGGRQFTATAANDPYFGAAASLLTDGVGQSIGARAIFHDAFGFAGGSLSGTERPYFATDLPGSVDFNGYAIGSMTLQVNLFEITPAPTPGSYFTRFEAMVVLSDSATAPLITPVAFAGRAGPQQLGFGQNLVLDASRSIGDIASYAWDLNRDGHIDFTATSPQLELTPAQYAPFFTPNAMRRVDLIVTDTGGKLSTDSYLVINYVPEPGAALSALALGAVSLLRRRKTR